MTVGAFSIANQCRGQDDVALEAGVYERIDVEVAVPNPNLDREIRETSADKPARIQRHAPTARSPIL